MIIYHYDDNGIYVGDGVADRSPEDIGEVYLIPAKATVLAPPGPVVGFHPVFNKTLGRWEQRPDIETPVVPESVEALQGLLALDQSGYASFYEVWANAPERTFAQRAFINKALTWKRNDPTLNAAASDLGLSSEQVDDLFRLAATL